MKLRPLLLSLLIPWLAAGAEERIKIGLPSALTGDASLFGTDIKNGILFGAERLAPGRFEFIVEDDKCSSKEAIAVAQKLINVAQVRYALGFACNAALLSSAPLYERAGVIVITSSATSGDVEDVGRNIFRLYPADQETVPVLYPYMAARHRKLGMLTEVEAYTELIERTIKKTSQQDGHRLQIVYEQVPEGTRDYKPALLRLKNRGIDGLFLNSVGEPSFMEMVRQLRSLGITAPLYNIYNAVSEQVVKQMGKEIEGIVTVNHPLTESLKGTDAANVLKAFGERYGSPLAGPMWVLFGYESVRVLDLALKSGRPPADYIRTTRFSGGPLGTFSFDAHGALREIGFQLQMVKDGKLQVVEFP